MNAPRLLSRRTASICVSCRQILQRKFSSTPTPPRRLSVLHPPRLRRRAPRPSRIRRQRCHKQFSSRCRRSTRQGPRSRTDSSIASPATSSARPQSPPLAELRSEPVPGKSSPAAPQSPAGTPTQTAKTSQTAAPAAATAPRPRSKLRAPRKAAMKLTPSAVETPPGAAGPAGAAHDQGWRAESWLQRVILPP